jgi:hypothetical protein
MEEENSMNDPTNRRRLLSGICMGLLALTLVANALAWLLPNDGGPATHGEIAGLGFLCVLQAGLHVGALIALTQLLRMDADRLALTGAALSTLGIVVGARIIALWQLSLVADPGRLTEGSVALKLQETAPIVWVSVVPIGLMYPIGMVLLGVALLRSRAVPRWIGVLFVAGAVLFPIGRAVGVPAAIIGSDLCLGIGYAALCRMVLREREVWGSGAVAVA